MTANFIHMTSFKWVHPYFVAVCVSLAVNFIGQAKEIEFNTDILDVNDRANIDLSNFSKSGYLMPGEYSFTVHINKQTLPEQPVFYYASPVEINESLVCLTPSLVEQFGLKSKILTTLAWWHDEQCLSFDSLPGTEVKADLAASILYINMPQAYLEYTAANWDPPTRWEDGVTGVMFDYNVNAQASQQTRGGERTSSNISGNGVAGVNLGVWRARADWQVRLDKQQGQNSTHSFDWSRYYVYRAIKSLGAKLTLGEDYLVSDIFDSFRFTGISLVTDINMLPPNLRGYAPEITGVAKSNATVIVSQQGRVLYQTQVAAGPFRIQDLNDAMSGELNVEVKEQDGSIQNFTVNTASVPYLTRPGQLRYKITTGRPTDWLHHVNGQTFASGEFSWGINNGWSLFGGVIGSENYSAAALGIGRDLMMFGALSFDVTHARAYLKGLPDVGNKNYNGNSYRLSYSKRFDEFNSQVTFAGYRFAEKGFMSMSDYLNAQSIGFRQYSNKEMYTISYNQQFTDVGLSAYLNYYHQTYWDQPDNDRYSLSLAKYLNFGKFKNLSVNLTAYRNRYKNTNDDGIYLSLSLPWGNSGSINMNSSWNKNDNTQRIGYYDRLDERNSYQLNTGIARSGALISGFYTHQGDIALINASATYQEDRYRSVGMSFQGGVTAIKDGVVLHRNNQMGGTRVFVDTDGVPNIPLRGYGASISSNRFGQAVLTDVNSYYRNQVSVDLNMLPENAQVTQSVKQGTLTEGAIGYRQFGVVAGASAMAMLRLENNSPLPFGALVFNQRGQQVGMVGDDGSTYLTGLNPNDVLLVRWDEKIQCEVTLPSILPTSETLLSSWFLPCNSVENKVDRPIIDKSHLIPMMKDKVSTQPFLNKRNRWLNN